MKVYVKRFDKNYPLPTYKTRGAAGADVCARESVVIPPHQVRYILANFAIKIPEGYWLLFAARGSTHKQGIMFANGIGIGDWDFAGDDDEYAIAALNFTDEEVTVVAGSRIGQVVLMKYEPMEIEETDRLDNQNRGKFGSTGVI